MRPALAATLLAPVIAAAACAPALECPTEAPAITSFTIDPATVAAGGDVQATLTVEGFELGMMEGDHHGDMADGGDGAMTEEMCAGGHVHVYLDDATSTNPLAMEGSASFSFTIPVDTPVGAHTLIARLHNRDHTIVDPQVTAEASITVE